MEAFRIIPIVELVKYLNQFDLRSLMQTCKELNEIFREIQIDIKKFSEEKVEKIFITLTEDEDSEFDFISIEYPYHGEKKIKKAKRLITERMGSYLKEIAMLILMENIPVKENMVLSYRYNNNIHPFEYDIISSKYLHRSTYYLNYYNLTPDLCIVNCQRVFILRDQSPFYLSNNLNYYDLVIPSERVYFYYSEDKLDYLEISYAKFCFRINRSNAEIYYNDHIENITLVISQKKVIHIHIPDK